MTNEPHAELVLLCTSIGNYLCFISEIMSIFVYEGKCSVVLLKVFPLLQNSVPANKFIIIHTLVEITPIKGIRWAELFGITRVSTSSVQMLQWQNAENL